jgi:hypothetical protein
MRLVAQGALRIFEYTGYKYVANFHHLRNSFVLRNVSNQAMSERSWHFPSARADATTERSRVDQRFPDYTI